MIETGEAENIFQKAMMEQVGWGPWGVLGQPPGAGATAVSAWFIMLVLSSCRSAAMQPRTGRTNRPPRLQTFSHSALAL